MVPDPVRAFVRRHPNVRYATRCLRSHLPQVLGGLDATLLPPRVRSFDLVLPRREGGESLGPDLLSLSVPGDYWVPRRLQALGLAGYRPEIVSCFLSVLDYARPGAVLDIGSGVGLYSLLAAARSRRRVYAFEPTPDVAATAGAIAAANGLAVRVEETALSNHTGTGWLRLSAVSEASNSLTSGFRPELGRVEVRVDTASRWRERDNIVPSVLRIDTGPTEPDVIAGALEILRRFRPWIMCGVVPDHGVEERLMALLEPLDYSWHHLCGPPPYPAGTTITASRTPRERTWLFAPEAPEPAFWENVRLWGDALKTCTPNA
ncbi:FkbM family methyltransferase [Nocardiopsis ansamitocini]|uniref:Methyltransferase FkbM domain-containing protein n=1 Tax=Nocardiopsis ansamitocini TaxID=1670832 RepID=A0A9W6P4A2_9ACTN|nr:FkbM family methyltransferase [Nocardiopsis ansamitocini]GLU46821.1 hypothetical protein Nans01_11720 [Nocardiopsis ansamitocini]